MSDRIGFGVRCVASVVDLFMMVLLSVAGGLFWLAGWWFDDGRTSHRVPWRFPSELLLSSAPYSADSWSVRFCTVLSKE